MDNKEKKAAEQAAEQAAQQHEEHAVKPAPAPVHDQKLPFDEVPTETAVEVLNQDGQPTGLVGAQSPETPNLAAILAHLDDVEQALENGEADVVNLGEHYWEAITPGERKVAVFEGFKNITKQEKGQFKTIECARFISKDGAFLLGGMQPVEDCKKLDINATVVITYQGTKKTSSGMNIKIFTFALVAGRKS